MFAIGPDVDLLFVQPLDDLAFIEDREADLAEARDDLINGRGLSGSTGVWGRFVEKFGGDPPRTEIVASVWASVAHRLGWLAIERKLSLTDLGAVVEATTDLAIGGIPTTASEIIDRFGIFSLEQRSVGSYVDSEGSWLSLDFDIRNPNGTGFVEFGESVLTAVSPPGRFRIEFVSPSDT